MGPGLGSHRRGVWTAEARRRATCRASEQGAGGRRQDSPGAVWCGGGGQGLELKLGRIWIYEIRADADAADREQT